MNCGIARRVLYSSQVLHGDKLAPVETEIRDAWLHLEQCAACRKFFAAENELSSLLRKRAPQETASPILREQVLGLIAEEQEQSKRPTRWSFLRRRSVILVLVLFLLVGLIFAGLWLRSRRIERLERLALILVDDHARYQSAATEVTSADPEVINAWFRDRVRFSVQPPRLPDSSLVGGRLCNLQGHPAALVVYRKPQNMISLFVLDGRDIELPREHLIALDERSCFVATERGYHVVMWKQRGLLYALVSDIRSADLLQLSTQF